MELERQGYIYSVKGKGSFVADSGRIRDSRRQEVCRHQEETAREALALGMDREELEGIIGRIYSEGGDER